jgi:hypothetical protein
MGKITLTAADGDTLTGRLPDSWAQVPLGAYARLAAAESLPDRIAATAALCNLSAQPLLDDVKHYGAIVAAAPWLFGGELPETPAAVSYFTHAGTTYHHVGNLGKINAGQLEALLTFLAENEGHPLGCAAGLLAVLYCPQGKQQTAKVVASSQQAFATLPMSVAWPALADFIRSSGSAARSILTVSALEEQTSNLLATLEQAQAMGGASSTFSQKVQRWLFRRWLRSARSQLSKS